MGAAVGDSEAGGGTVGAAVGEDVEGGVDVGASDTRGGIWVSGGVGSGELGNCGVRGGGDAGVRGRELS